MINVKNFIKVGKFSEKFFMFWEEVDLCKSVINNAQKTLSSWKLKYYVDTRTKNEVKRTVFEMNRYEKNNTFRKVQPKQKKERIPRK